MDDQTQQQPNGRTRLGGWACFSVAVLLVAGMVASILFAGGLVWAFRRHHHTQHQATTSVVVRAPIFISGPAIEMSLPAGTNLTSSTVDSNGGNWWYQDPGTGTLNLQLLIAASKFGSAQPSVSDSYFERVIRIVEHSSGDLVTSMGNVESTTVGSYAGRRASYDVTQMNGAHEHAVALLIRRESDDLLVILYGDESASASIDRTAQEMFSSLRPRPTPQRYDVHSVQISVPDHPRDF